MSNHYVVDFNPILISLGPIDIRWYGLMYVIAFIVAAIFLRLLIKRKFIQIPIEKADALMTTILIGMFVGARLAYVFIYNWGYYQQNLLEIFAIWQGGLSFHGGLAGVLAGGYFFAKRNNISWFQIMDCVALCGTPGLFFGRIGNFINGELYGRVTDHWMGMIFVGGGPYPRHPSQLYQAFSEGLLLSIILWILLPRFKYYGHLSSTFLIGYGSFRYIVEFFREPDPQLGYYLWGTTTMGQILCMIMIVLGMGSFWYFSKKKITR